MSTEHVYAYVGCMGVPSMQPISELNDAHYNWNSGVHYMFHFRRQTDFMKQFNPSTSSTIFHDHCRTNIYIGKNI